MACNTSFSLAGINRLFLATVSASTVNYSYTNDNVYLNDSFEWIEIEPESSNLKQKKVVDQKGSYFNKIIELSVNNFMNEVLEPLENERIIIIIEDNGGNFWITGHEKQYIINKYDGETGGNQNQIELTLVQNSYLKLESIDLTSVTGLSLYSYNTYINTSSLFDSIITGGTIAFWIKYNSYPVGEKIIEMNNKFSINHDHNGTDFLFNNTYFESGSTVPNYNNTSDSTLILDNWYFVITRFEKNFFPLEIFHTVFDNSLNLITHNSIALDASLASSNYPLQLYRSNLYQIKHLGIWSRSLEIDLLNETGEVYTLQNEGSGADYEVLDNLDTDLLTGLIAYYNTIDFSSNTVEDKHTNNLNLNFDE